jgi:hypothetical protein
MSESEKADKFTESINEKLRQMNFQRLEEAEWDLHDTIMNRDSIKMTSTKDFAIAFSVKKDSQ